MDYSPSSWILAAITFLLWQKNVNAISCYICSWSPQDKEVEADRCSKDHFDERRVQSVDCDIGCEVVQIHDSNGELLMFYRNCLRKSPNKLEYDSIHKKISAQTSDEYQACESDLCNSSVSHHAVLALLLISIIPTFL